MIVAVEKQFKQVESQREQVLNDVMQLSHDQQNFKPDPESWSILQVLNHLIYSETNMVKYLQKKLLGVESTEKAGIQSSVRSTLLNIFLKLPIKYKAPYAAMPQQEEVYVFDNLKKQWDEVRAEFGKILDQLDTASANKLIFKHPVAGRFNIYQTLSFLQEHIDHHKKQIERIKKSSVFPS